MSMNPLNQQILSILKDNARCSYKDIADMVSQPLDEVKKIISTLESDGIILQYTTIINTSLSNLGPSPIHALVELSIRPERQTGYDAIAKKILGHPHVIAWGRCPLY